MAEKKTARVPIVLEPTLLARIDEWRGRQPGIPSRSEVLRRGVELLLSEVRVGGPEHQAPVLAGIDFEPDEHTTRRVEFPSKGEGQDGGESAIDQTERIQRAVNAAHLTGAPAILKAPAHLGDRALITNSPSAPALTQARQGASQIQIGPVPAPPGSRLKPTKGKR